MIAGPYASIAPCRAFNKANCKEVAIIPFLSKEKRAAAIFVVFALFRREFLLAIHRQASFVELLPYHAAVSDTRDAILFPRLFLCEPDARSFPIFVDEDHASFFEGVTNRGERLFASCILLGFEVRDRVSMDGIVNLPSAWRASRKSSRRCHATTRSSAISRHAFIASERSDR